MLKKLFAVLVLCCALTSMSVFPTAAEARTTKAKYDSSGICMITIMDAVNFLAEPDAMGLVIATVPKGSKFVPINQANNAKEKKVYNLVVREDGAVGWINSDVLKIVPKR